MHHHLGQNGGSSWLLSGASFVLAATAGLACGAGAGKYLLHAAHVGGEQWLSCGPAPSCGSAVMVNGPSAKCANTIVVKQDSGFRLCVP